MKPSRAVLLAGLVGLVAVVSGCDIDRPIKSISGTKMVPVGKVRKDTQGLTVEQANIKHRIMMDNQPGAIKHLYIISAYSGQVLIYSTVMGKVTSSGKRLTPSHTVGNSTNSFQFKVGNHIYDTDEVLGEDGTFGSSIEYLYWWDSKGVYHQQYVTGGMIPHISDQPLAVKSVIINMEVSRK
ncbi:MAG: hypothetical protein US94_C0004G0005 [Berkelbacteria bacterium GW2011_GWB1_38_5]|uniref:Lipoprotein n=2 Tax=Candidatus Berkelbacteria TaxID=1618330 RepID=A0A0G0NY12_9BACT|nr:MAG: hypothetical protein US94_C0004G0005 [Berkelbacteria bacterium GW2011_GWB1_38_5]KKQ90704.1 MAG: hypothetical protein UT15_C0006G0005 [Berkelbacteria bacterium GW2011_GWA1_39_10]